MPVKSVNLQQNNIGSQSRKNRKNHQHLVITVSFTKPNYTVSPYVWYNVQGHSKWLSGFQQLVIHNTLEIAVYVFFLFNRTTLPVFVTYLTGALYVPPLPASIPELKVRIRTAIQTITADMVQTVWNELDYRVDICRITKGAHIEHL